MITTVTTFVMVARYDYKVCVWGYNAGIALTLLYNFYLSVRKSDLSGCYDI